MVRPLRAFLFLPFACALVLPGFSGDEDHWAFQPFDRPAVPEWEGSEVAGHGPIDAFVRSRLREAGLTPSPQAQSHVLLRRLHLDLTGLPPTLEEMAEFRERWNADPEAAYAEKVDALLDSPHFGERWALPWLDLARYADSDGYLGDSMRPGAWVYRDWVIDSINRDLPFDQFSIEQLAGDLLPGATQEQRIATGFHRNNLKNTEAGADRELNRTKQVVDRVATTGTTWLGLTIACAECHDHKHDPITQREFYQLYAVFNNTKDADITVETDDACSEEGEEKEKKLKAQTLVELGEKDRRETHIHIRGQYDRPGERVEPGTPAILHPFRTEKPDRLAFAHWLFAPENPLTARVAVNQIWQGLFGVGIVPTSDDFGTYGADPTHPDLLDWLACEFRESGWSRKSLIRTIVLSATYRQSSVNTFPDRSNELLWRQNAFRLPAELVRDVHLAAGGLLSRTTGGPGIRPPLPSFVTAVGRTVKWPVSEGADRYRRGLYIVLKRTVLYPMLTAFDAPDTSAACSRRERTNSPLQALTLLNDPVFFECAEHLGREAIAGGAAPEQAIATMFRRCLNREPDATERKTLREAHRYFQETAPDSEHAMIATARILMNLDEFITRD